MSPDWRTGTATVLVFLHDANCIACRSFSQSLASLEGAFGEWGARLWVIWRGQKVPDGCPGVADPTGDARRQVLDGDSSGVAVVDAYGCVVHRLGTSGRSFPDPKELVAMVKGMALACPECGIADGGWASLPGTPSTSGLT